MHIASSNPGFPLIPDFGKAVRKSLDKKPGFEVIPSCCNYGEKLATIEILGCPENKASKNAMHKTSLGIG